MNLYEISKALEDLIDKESGEVSDYDAFLALNMEAEQKKVDTALWIKNLRSDSEQLSAEIKSLKERKDAIDHKADRLTEYLQTFLAGEKISTPKVSVSYRKTKVVETDDEFIGWAAAQAPEYLRVKTEVDKTAIKNDMKAGLEIPHVQMVEHQSMSIK